MESVLSVTISTLKKAAKDRSFTDLILLRQLLKEVTFFADRSMKAAELIKIA